MVYELTEGDRRVKITISQIAARLSDPADDVADAVAYLVNDGQLENEGAGIAISRATFAALEPSDQPEIRRRILAFIYEAAGGSAREIVDIHDIARRVELGFGATERALAVPARQSRPRSRPETW